MSIKITAVVVPGSIPEPIDKKDNFTRDVMRDLM